MIYYNEFDPKAAYWLRRLMKAGLIPKGHVDERSITEVQPEELKGYTQCHFFAGIGGWAKALHLAGYPAERPVWTGSCPCPPFSSAGKKKTCPTCGEKSPVPCPRRTGYFICRMCYHAWFADARHLWPEFWRLISFCRPPKIYGEQVSGTDGAIWFSGVRATLEIISYSAWSADLAAASLNAPHLRQRLFWMAQSHGGDSGDRGVQRGRKHRQQQEDGVAGGLANTQHQRKRKGDGQEAQRQWGDRSAVSSTTDRMGDTEHQGPQERSVEPGVLSETVRPRQGEKPVGRGAARRMGHAASSRRRQDDSQEWAGSAETGSGFWDNYEYIPCIDGKARRTKPGVCVLAHGVRGRVAQLRGLGNAIVPQVAAEFIKVSEGW